MATPLRKKRNFKALQLPTSPTGEVEEPESIAGAAKKRPPPLDESDGKTIHQLGVDAPDTARSAHASLTSTLRSMDINKGQKEFHLKNEDLRNIHELGQGNGGSVVKVEHVPTGTIMAKKIVLIDAKPSVRKQILRELQIMHNCDSPYIISSYGSFLSEPNICICMEFMDKGSFDGIYKKIGAIDINIVCMVATAVLEGLIYLYNVHKIIHRDIKPSNILCNSQGDIKLCDFGVSGELINSIANTFVGTSIYMSPERIQGGDYSVKSDVWSLGITIIELAHGRFPFNDSYSDDSDLEGSRPGSPTTPTKNNRDSLQVPLSANSRSKRRRSKGVSLHGGGMTMSIIELMHQIVKEPAPRLGPEGRFSKDAEDFVDACLMKVLEERKNPAALMKMPWIQACKANPIDFKAWTATF